MGSGTVTHADDHTHERRQGQPAGTPARWLRGLGTALVAALVLSATQSPGSAAAAAPKRQPTANVHFNDPLGSSAEQRRLLTQLIGAVKRAPARSTLRMAVFSFGDPETADAVIAAYRRGVRVKIVFAGNHTYPAMARIMKVVGSDTSARSFAVQCDASCRGSRGQMHAKYFSFGHTGDRRWVTMVGSVNVTRHNAEQQWADLYTVADDRAYYRAYLHWFKQLKQDQPLDEPYTRKSVPGNQIDFTPLTVSATRPDPVLRALDNVRCEVTKGDIDPDAKHPDRVVATRLLIGAYAWNGDRGKRIAWKVAHMQAAGCRTKVFFGDGIGGAVRSILAHHGVALRESARRKVTTHEKLMIVHGAVGDHARTTWAWTGSHNWSSRALRRDDLIVRVTDEQVALDYRSGFLRMWDRGKVVSDGSAGD